MELQDTDQITVRALSDEIRGDVVSIEGDGVIHPGTYELTRENQGLGIFLQMAELFEDAVRDRVTPIRMGENFVKQKSILDLDVEIGRGFRLQDEDRLHISSRFELGGGDKEITISGHSKQTGPFLLPTNLSLADVLFQYTGLTDPGFRFTRTWGGEPRLVALDMERALAGHPCHDIVLHAGDEIYIPPSNSAVNVRGQVTVPGVTQHLAGKDSRYYVEAMGGYLANADVRNSHIIRANGLILKATRRFWFDPEVPPGSTIVVPEKAPGGPLWGPPGSRESSSAFSPQGWCGTGPTDRPRTIGGLLGPTRAPVTKKPTTLPRRGLLISALSRPLSGNPEHLVRVVPPGRSGR